MAYGVTDIIYLRSIFDSFREIKCICDLGLQEMNCTAGHEYLKEFISACNRKAEIDISEVISSFTNGYMDDFWKACGKSYAALDILGKRDFMFFDLNFDSVPKELENHFDLVCNAGTTEHIVNQYNGFKTIHDLTRVNGYMYHALPMGGFQHHGLFNYNVKFFYSLCTANKYKWIDAYISLGECRVGLDADIVRALNQDKDFLPVEQRGLDSIMKNLKATDVGLRIVLKKVKKNFFCAPIDLLGAEIEGFEIGGNGRIYKK